MKIRSLFLDRNMFALSLKDLVDALRRLLFPRPIPVPVERKMNRSLCSITLNLSLALLFSSCAKKDEATSTTTSTSSERISISAKPSTSTAKTGESAGGASPLGQQMLAQQIVEDISGGSDIRAGRKAAVKIDAINEGRKADMAEMEQ